MIDKTLYTEESIESLSPLEFTRLRPGVYAGDTTYATQLAVEIFSKPSLNLFKFLFITTLLCGHIVTKN